MELKWGKLGTGRENSNSGIDWFYYPSIILPTIADNVGNTIGYT